MVLHVEQSDKCDRVSPHDLPESHTLSADQHNSQGNAILSTSDAQKQKNPAMDKFPSCDSLLVMTHSGPQKTGNDGTNSKSDSKDVSGKSAPGADSSPQPSKPGDSSEQTAYDRLRTEFQKLGTSATVPSEKGSGANTQDVLDLLVQVPPDARKSFAAQYQKDYGKSITDDLKSSTSASDLKTVNNLLAESSAPITDLNQFVGVGKAILNKISPDGSPVTESELDKAMEDPSYKGQEAQVLTALYATYGVVKSAQGITASDLDKLPQINADLNKSSAAVASLSNWANTDLAKYAEPGSDGAVTEADINKALANPAVSATDKSNLRQLDGLYKTVTDITHYNNIEASDLQQFSANYPTSGADGSMMYDLDRAVIRVSGLESSKYVSSLYATSDPAASIKSDAIVQGRMGDCFFESSLASVVHSNPQAIANAIQDNQNGTYTVTFPGAKQFPVTVSAPSMTELALFNHGGQYGTWASVMEKAYGELTKEQPGLMASISPGSNAMSVAEDNAGFATAVPRDADNPVSAYAGDDMVRAQQLGLMPQSKDAPLPQGYLDGGGIPGDAMYLLTGNRAPVTEWVPSAGNPERIAQQLEKAFSTEPPLAITAGTAAGGTFPENIESDHAYSVMGFKPDGHGGGTVSLRNPYGYNSIGDPRPILNLSLGDFMKYYATLYIEQR